MTNDLNTKTCEPCTGGIAAMTANEARKAMAQLNPTWLFLRDGKALMLRLEFKGFAKAVYHANLAAYLGDAQGHHPDIRFGWGYCEVEFTTHDADGLTQNDFICAAKFDQLIKAA